MFLHKQTIENALQAHFSSEYVSELLHTPGMIYTDKYYTIFHPNALRDKLYAMLEQDNEANRATKKHIDELVERFTTDIREEGIKAIDSWAYNIECTTCDGCPAYQWMTHMEGNNKCALSSELYETKSKEGCFSAVPINECIRPTTVGACYLIAKEKGLPSPIVGKLSSSEKEQYIKQKEKKNDT